MTPDPVARVSAGDRCQLHPATDRWMMGDRFGDVVSVVKADRRKPFDRVRVKLDRSGRTLTFPAWNVLAVD
jgi:hypothetical protein